MFTNCTKTLCYASIQKIHSDWRLHSLIVELNLYYKILTQTNIISGIPLIWKTTDKNVLRFSVLYSTKAQIQKVTLKFNEK